MLELGESNQSLALSGVPQLQYHMQEDHAASGSLRPKGRDLERSDIPIHRDEPLTHEKEPLD